MAEKLPSDLDVSEPVTVTRQIGWLNTPVVEIVKSVRRPSRRDCADVGVSNLRAVILAPDVTPLPYHSRKPPTHSQQVMKRPAIAAVASQMSRVKSSSAVLKLRGARDPHGHNSTIRLETKLPVVRLVKALYPGKIAKTASTHDISVSKVFKKAKPYAFDVSITRSKVNVTQSAGIGSKAVIAKVNVVNVNGTGLGWICRTMTRRTQRAHTPTFFDMERRELAKRAHIDESRVKWIGLFHNVPITAVERLAVDEQSGRLVVTLRENASSIVRAGSVSIAMGRDTISGNIVQQIIPKSI